MARWSDLATWRGPTPNQSGAMQEVRGLVIHIAVGYFEGTISWQRNPDADVSSHFIVGRDGRCAQMVDTDVTAWTQGAGNGHWLSSENEGFLLGHKLWKPGWHELSAQMIEKNAQLLARAHRDHAVPLQLATHPDGRGLGYHSMGAENGYRWGHSACPGEPIKAQLPLIVARAKEITGGQPRGDRMFFLKTHDNPAVYVSNGVHTRAVPGGQWDITCKPLIDAGVRLLSYKDLAELLHAGGPLATDTAPVQLSDADRQAIIAGVVAQMPKPPTVQEIAKAVNVDAAARLAS